ncbi:PucR family transcriptional regulator ligand-binding domain-containing protein (plasmid) [Deinococcus taeanensis]|uniref:PucR family transcriptional regulator n=1 Tax=Deinococcus taeanensis TaxID=2737050 RepID=UPI001CDCABD9|nr:PucR family transcriptional regulator [Deinococcus taeanensis]UBV44651.1 PucR family transcriptional regulator ligand-binding domain-containing protein [Deinococcus taeanensis]
MSDVLALPACTAARLVMPGADLSRAVRLAHVIDIPEPQRWVRPGTLLLTTGLSWPHDSGALAAFGELLAACEPAGVVLAVPHFFTAFPPEIAGPLEARRIPAVELAWEVPFVQVVQEVHEFILRAQSDVLERSEAIHCALTRAALGGTPADVAATLSAQLGRAVALLARDGAPLTAGPAPDAAQARQALDRPGAAPRDLAGGVLVPVLLRGQREGGVWVAGDGKPASDLVVRGAEHAATVAALLMLAQRDLEVREARLGYAFVDTLLEGQYTDDPAAQERAHRLGFHPRGLYRVALLVLADELPLSPEGFARRERAAHQVREVLSSLGAAPLVSVNLNQVWFLLPEDVRAERVWARLGGAAAAPPPRMVYGRARPGTAGIAQSRAEVLALAAYARPGELRSYAEVLVPRALSGDRDAQADLLHSLLSPLRGARGGEALIATVQALCETGFAQAEAAARLGIHGNTLRYRMERIEALTHRALAEPANRSLWWLALQIDAMTP